jgi:hypothetical protein
VILISSVEQRASRGAEDRGGCLGAIADHETCGARPDVPEHIDGRLEV